MSSPLVITADAVLLDEVQRLAAAAGVTPEVCTSDHHALTRWADAPLVLVGADVAAALAALRPARRDATHLLVHGPVGDDIFSVALALGAESVAELPRSESWLVEVLTDAGDRAPRRGLTVGVVGGSGGAGATTFACALGQIGAGRNGAGRSSALVVDLDPLGPGLDRVLGVELHDGIRWDALLETTGRLSARSLHDAVPRRDGLGILTWASGPAGTLQAFAVREALSAAQRGHDLVVVDLPRTVDALFAEVVARCDLLVVVTRPTVAGRRRDGAVASAAEPGPGRRGCWCAATASRSVRSSRPRACPGPGRWGSSVAWPRRSTSVSGRCARAAARSPERPPRRSPSWRSRPPDPGAERPRERPARGRRRCRPGPAEPGAG